MLLVSRRGRSLEELAEDRDLVVGRALELGEADEGPREEQGRAGGEDGDL
jgi:hypothetical protein